MHCFAGSVIHSSLYQTVLQHIMLLQEKFIHFSLRNPPELPLDAALWMENRLHDCVGEDASS